MHSVIRRAMMPRLSIIIIATALFYSSCQNHHTTSEACYVQAEGTGFVVGGVPYSYIGCNLWYGALLGSEASWGDRDRLCRELDLLSEMGIKNVRVLAGGEGVSDRRDHIRPTMQPCPGSYNDTLLEGLDYLMQQLGRRGMKAVLYLHNAWQWSGGFGTYLEWAGCGEAAPADDWDAYQAYHRQFVSNDSARSMALRHTRFMVSRTNRLTGVPYAEDPALMAWEICNEPRPFSRDSVTKAHFVEWIAEQAQAIRAIDPNHLITTGSEGLYGCEVDIDLFEQIHLLPDIDYLCVHLWPFTWNWVGTFASPSTAAKAVNKADILEEEWAQACRHSDGYMEQHIAVAKKIGKPLVIEEFGYPRDRFEIACHTPTAARDRYYEHLFGYLQHGVAGCNFWAWGGTVEPPHPFWQQGDPYTGDPAQEEQGLYSVFSTDSTTLAIVKKYIPLQKTAKASKKAQHKTP